MKELTFITETTIRQRTKADIAKHYDDLKLLRYFYKNTGNISKSLEVLNWPLSKVQNYAHVLRGK